MNTKDCIGRAKLTYHIIGVSKDKYRCKCQAVRMEDWKGRPREFLVRIRASRIWT